MADSTTTQTVTAPTPSTSSFSLPSFNTGVPFIGTVDLSSPVELAAWGGFLASLFFIKGNSKWLVAIGILALRYELSKA